MNSKQDRTVKRSSVAKKTVHVPLQIDETKYELPVAYGYLIDQKLKKKHRLIKMNILQFQEC